MASPSGTDFRYGEEIARLRLAETLTKKALDSAKRGVAESVTSDVKVGNVNEQPNLRVSLVH